MLHSVMHEEEQESVTESWTNVCDLCQQLLDESRLHCCPHFLSVWSTWVHYHSKDSRGMWEEYQIPQSFLKKERPYLSCLVQLYEEVLYVITKFWALKVTDFIFQVDELKSRNFQNFYFSLCRNCFALSLFTVFCWWRCPGWLSRSGYANTLDNIFFAKSILYISVCVQWAILSFNVLLSNKAPGFLNQFAVQSLHMTIFRGIYVFVCLLKHLINDP